MSRYSIREIERLLDQLTGSTSRYGDDPEDVEIVSEVVTIEDPDAEPFDVPAVILRGGGAEGRWTRLASGWTNRTKVTQLFSNRFIVFANPSPKLHVPPRSTKAGDVDNQKK